MPKPITLDLTLFTIKVTRMKALLIILFLLIPLSAKTLFWKRIGSNYDDPVGLKALGGGNFLVLEKPGIITLTDFKGNKGEILNWKKKVTDKSQEQGFLGIALDTKFHQTGRAYFYVTNKKGNTEIWRYTFNPQKLSEAKADPELLLSFDQPYRNHNGGWLGFGPDGMLYIATGDGGSANDPKNFAQNLDSYLGKILRIDVSGAKGYSVPSNNPFIDKSKPEIYAYGLRNPWRCYWHESNFIIADVGQQELEEINYVSSSNLRGANFGWRLREGKVATPKNKVGGNKPSGAIEPCLVYPHTLADPLSGISITGGVVYNGSIQSLKGKYLFADFGVPRVWAAKLSSSSHSELFHFGNDVLPDAGLLNNITSFTRGLDGEVYITCFHGDIFKLSEKQSTKSILR